MHLLEAFFVYVGAREQKSKITVCLFLLSFLSIEFQSPFSVSFLPSTMLNVALAVSSWSLYHSLSCCIHSLCVHPPFSTSTTVSLESFHSHRSMLLGRMQGQGRKENASLQKHCEQMGKSLPLITCHRVSQPAAYLNEMKYT